MTWITARATIGDGDRKLGFHTALIEKDKCAIFRENRATLNVISARGTLKFACTTRARWI